MKIYFYRHVKFLYNYVNNYVNIVRKTVSTRRKFTHSTLYTRSRACVTMYTHARASEFHGYVTNVYSFCGQTHKDPLQTTARALHDPLEG